MGHSAHSLILSDKIRFVLISALLVLAYLPALNNGFIADDWVILERIEFIKADILYLHQAPPENFRSTSYVVFGVLKYLAGYQPAVYYLFNIGLHLVNTALLFSLVRILIRDEQTAWLAALLFAVFQAPQEAVMWLAAMNETLLAFFLLLTLISWTRERYVLAAFCCALALFSKESAAISLLMLPLLNVYQKRPFFKGWAFLALPVAVFAAVFVSTYSQNFMIGNRSYALGPHAVLVLANSMHRLAWPWVYILIILARMQRKSWPSRRLLAACLLAVIPMLPYMFITYQSNLPSRQVYLASAVLMTVLACVLRTMETSKLVAAFISIFVVFNIAYIWLRKDAQFEERAAPTSELVKVLEQRAPERIYLRGFAYPYPEIARATTLKVSGWLPQYIVFEREDCKGCPELRWNAEARRYE